MTSVKVDKHKNLTILSKEGSNRAGKLETFDRPKNVTIVRLVCDEVSSLCEVTHQPDLSVVHIEYHADKVCLESKSLKMYLWRLRDQTIFCEGLASKMVDDLYEAVEPFYIRVTVEQKSRGGIAIVATAHRFRSAQP